MDPAMLVDLGVLDESDGWVLGGDLGGAHCSPDAGQVFASLVDSEMPEQSDEDLAMKLVELGAAAVVRSPEFDPLRLVGFATPQARPGAFGYSDLVVLGAEYAGRVELDRLLWTEVRWVAGGVVLRTLLDHEALESLRNAFQRILVSPIGPALLSRHSVASLPWLASTDRRRLAATVVGKLQRAEAAGEEPPPLAAEVLRSLNPDDFLDPEPD